MKPLLDGILALLLAPADLFLGWADERPSRPGDHWVQVGEYLRSAMGQDRRALAQDRRRVKRRCGQR